MMNSNQLNGSRTESNPTVESEPRVEFPERDVQPFESRPAREISVLWVAVPFLVLLLAIALLRVGQSRSTPSAIGKPAPQIDLVKLQDNAETETLASLNEGTVTLLHFWGTWCGPCKMEYPELDEMASRFQGSSRFQFLSVSCESGPNETFEGLTEKTIAYLRAGDMTQLAYADPKGMTRISAAQRLELNALYYPTSILVGPDGMIAEAWLGYTPEAVQQMESRIEDLLSE